MRNTTLFRSALGPIGAVAFAFGLLSGCNTTSSGDDATGDGGEGGDQNSGGDGGNASSGGDGGQQSSKGGTGGGSKGGSGGTANSGGSGGSSSGGSGGTTGGSGGTTGGSGGTTGGSGGSSGGSGGSAGTSAAIPPIEGPGVLFSGKEMVFTKMVATDTKPGYGRSGAPGTSTFTPIIEVTDAALPAGTKYVLNADVTAGGMTVFQWNWREDEADTAKAQDWKWFDASPYAGISFWAKGDRKLFFQTISYDSQSLGTNESSTTKCAGALRDDCGGGYMKVAVIEATWKRFVLPFAGFSPAITDAKEIGRIDMFTSGSYKMQVTGIMLLTQAQLP